MASAALDLLSEVFEPDGTVQPDRLSGRLRVTRLQLAAALGLSKDAVTKQSRLQAPKTQARLRDAIEILNRIRPWAGSDEAAFAWYRSAPLPSFGDLTAEDLVKQGRAEAVKRHVSRIAAGGYG
ncbi:antitoxin Xre/MbcA/ParS toxin-binding domain-containing protein [Roseicella sp. DB1501]|uniref:antitoxin Xre/MbcA/ParS toxin-binding domain-containing protein n=1 Tax=Roseicella sp. DB1501 TaxID=2730925 RepID=UPI001492F161|nr:antitoxin Xre/MbcA/ParS toxin-binding domain-containing protein [Roseicella sp. DB1501]NOG73446.1 DUF2384 domain-containing protein [Roseicella sp. DB1501]